MNSSNIDPRNPIDRSPWRGGLLLIPLVLAWFALPGNARATDGGLPNYNTVEGDNALVNLTSGGFNTAIGYAALYTNTTGGGNTATFWGRVLIFDIWCALFP